MIPPECGVLEGPPSSGHIVGNGRFVVVRRPREARPSRGQVHCAIADRRANSLSVGTLKRSMILLAEMDEEVPTPFGPLPPLREGAGDRYPNRGQVPRAVRAACYRTGRPPPAYDGWFFSQPQTGKKINLNNVRPMGRGICSVVPTDFETAVLPG